MHRCRAFQASSSREEGIRTPDTVTRIHTFQACSLNHSDTSLFMGCKYRFLEGNWRTQFCLKCKQQL